MENEERDAGGLNGLSSAEAYRVLDTLVAIQQVTPAAGDGARARYDALRAALAAATERQRALQAAAAQLQERAADAEQQARAAQRRTEEFGGVSIEVLREDVEAAQTEAALADERCALLALEAVEAARQRDELAESLENAADVHAAELQPLIEAARADVALLQDSLQEQRDTLAAARAELAAAQQQGSELEGQVAELRREQRGEANQLLSVQADPERARRQADLAAAGADAARAAAAAAEARVLEAGAAARGAADGERGAQARHVAALAALERARIMAEAKERHVAEVSKDAELAAGEAERALADGAGLAVTLRGLDFEVRRARLAAAAALRERDAALRALKAAGGAADEARGELPALGAAAAAAAREKGEWEGAAAAARSAAAAAAKDVEDRISAYLEEEEHGKEEAAMYLIVRKEAQLLLDELAALKGEDAARARLLADITGQRDRAARQLGANRAKARGVQGEVLARSRQVEDLRLARAELARRSRDYEQLYDLVRNQRNRFVALISAAGQARAEAADRLRLVGAEAGVLAGDAGARAKLVARAKQAHAGAVKERDALRADLHRLGGVFRQRHEALEAAAAEAARLNADVGRAGVDMQLARDRYGAAVTARNATGLMLIDRSDELAALFERSHAAEARLRAGAAALQRQGDETRAVRLQVLELERAVGATRAALPNTDGMDREVMAIKAALHCARRDAEELSLQLEDPANPRRARLLGGRVPDREELVARLQTLEERLGMKRQEAADKGVVLQEVTALTEELREEAATSRGARADASQAANACQQRLRQVTSRIMAAISELSLYQATALRLHGERAGLVALVEDAKARLTAGLPPTQDAEGEWQRQQREAATLAELQRRREEDAAVLDARGALVDTAAEARPGAYVPDDLGIPRPFGQFPPFKPAPPGGAAARAARPPAARPVVV